MVAQELRGTRGVQVWSEWGSTCDVSHLRDSDGVVSINLEIGCLQESLILQTGFWTQPRLATPKALLGVGLWLFLMADSGAYRMVVTDQDRVPVQTPRYETFNQSGAAKSGSWSDRRVLPDESVPYQNGWLTLSYYAYFDASVLRIYIAC